MATVKLNAHIRSSIRDRLMRHKFEEEIRQLTMAFAEFSEEVYKYRYDEVDREMLEAPEKGWFPESSSITVKFGPGSEGYTTLPYNGRYDMNGLLSKHGPRGKDRPDTLYRRMASKDIHTVAVEFPITHRLSKRFFERKRWRDSLEETMHYTDKQVMAALNSVTTIGALLKEWPEVKPFAEDWTGPRPGLPALPTYQLNNMLGLSVDGEVS